METVAETIAFRAADKAARYRELLPQLASLIEGEPDLVANLANAAAALRECVTAASWVGFYVRRGGELVLGPFQGKIACVRIAMGKGVCGTSAAERRVVIVPDVEQFPGYIACDAGTRSELVMPIVRAGEVVAVLDLDSHQLAAFDEIDAAGLAPIVELLGTLAW